MQPAPADAEGRRAPAMSAALRSPELLPTRAGRRRGAAPQTTGTGSGRRDRLTRGGRAVESQIGVALGPRRTELFQRIVNAWLSTDADDRQPVRGLSGDDRIRLLPPGLGGQEVYASIDDPRAF